MLQDQNPPPKPPFECAEKLCFPILDPADIEASRWIQGLYEEIKTALVVAQDTDASGRQHTIDDLGQLLRAAEVQLRGELSLAGVDADCPDWIAEIWDRGSGPACELPAYSSLEWLDIDSI